MKSLYHRPGHGRNQLKRAPPNGILQVVVVVDISAGCMTDSDGGGKSPGRHVQESMEKLAG